MKVIGDFLAAHDTDGGGEFRVERWHPIKRVHRQMSGRVKMSDLSQRVHAGISPSGAVEPDFFTCSGGDGGFDEILHGLTVGLRLPTAKSGAVVGNGELETHNGKTTSQCSR